MGKDSVLTNRGWYLSKLDDAGIDILDTGQKGVETLNTVLKFDELENMNQLEAKTFYTVLESVLANDDGAASKSHLAAGRPIYYCEDRYPDAMVRKWPDGRRELVEVDHAGTATFIRAL